MGNELKNYNYKIITDSSCDFSQDMAHLLDVEAVPLMVTIKGENYFNYLDGREISNEKYYSYLRKGITATTSAVNASSFIDFMEPILQNGQDILYIGFSSALSCTCSSAFMAAEELKKKYPDRKIIAVDSLCASLGQGLLIFLAAKQRAEGKTIDQVAEYVENIKLNICHWFTVDDLNHLKRGGRIPKATALLGTALQIKPVMHMNDEGKLENVSKARGRKASLRALVEKMEETAVDPSNQTVFISHGDCFEDANFLANMVRERLRVKDIFINYVGPVIGTHSGPGTLALFFIGKHR